MKPYKDRSGNSGVKFYEIGEDWIRVRFVNGDVYKYSEKSAGKEHIDQMKILAETGKGLSGYISRYVHDLYEK
ncbi:MAG TPA: hypothetical protein VD996_02785 [Chitinophagaceae bacterium]|nr:hypothetical protein [Chitinophagaceae bacterium]